MGAARRDAPPFADPAAPLTEAAWRTAAEGSAVGMTHTSPHRRALLAAAGLAFALAFAQAPPPPEASPPRPAPSASRVGRVRTPRPSGASSRSRRIAAIPSSRKIRLSYVRFASTAAKPGPPIIYLAGGPGGGDAGGGRPALSDLHGPARGGRRHRLRPAGHGPVQPHPGAAGLDRARRPCSTAGRADLLFPRRISRAPGPTGPRPAWP